MRPDLEQADFAAEAGSPGPRFTVAAYNLERGMHWERQARLLQTHPALRDADVVLLSEADRGCSRTGGAHVAFALARACRRHVAFGVQYVELPRRARRAVNRVDCACEHGNAILSRWPLERVTLLRHLRSTPWSDHPREPRLGGCTTVRAEVRWGQRSVRLYSVHFDSGWSADDLRAGQARDLVDDAAGWDGPVVIGGDMNTFRYTADVRLGTRWDPTPPVLTEAGYRDAHAHLPPSRRGTTGRHFAVRGVIDLIWARGLEAEEAGVVSPRWADRLSDHLPVWASLRDGTR